MKRCMIVDDSNVIRKVARRILSGSDMIVSEACDGREALAACAREMPDIIVVDSHLPDMPTVEFISQVTRMDAQTAPRVVICMTEFDVGTIMRAKRAGAKGYILKPFNRPILLERFREMQVAA